MLRTTTLEALAEILQGKNSKAEIYDHLGLTFSHGVDVDEDPEQAVKNWTHSSNLGLAPAQRHLAHCYEKGKGVAQSDEEAFKWYHSAALQCDPTSQVRLGVLYNTGRGCKKDYVKAFCWYQKAADQDFRKGQLFVAICHLQGIGVAQNFETACQWLQKAADQGDFTAQYNLGILNQRGTGVPQNFEKARSLYKSASKKGYAPAYAALVRLEALSGEPNMLMSLKYFDKAQEALTAVCAACLPNQERLVGRIYDDTNLTSFFSCHNQGCGVAYSQGACVQNAKLKSCACCKVVYCSVECQAADWNYHRTACSKMTAAPSPAPGADPAASPRSEALSSAPSTSPTSGPSAAPSPGPIESSTAGLSGSGKGDGDGHIAKRRKISSREKISSQDFLETVVRNNCERLAGLKEQAAVVAADLVHLRAALRMFKKQKP